MNVWLHSTSDASTLHPTALETARRGTPGLARLGATSELHHGLLAVPKESRHQGILYSRGFRVPADTLFLGFLLWRPSSGGSTTFSLTSNMPWQAAHTPRQHDRALQSPGAPHSCVRPGTSPDQTATAHPSGSGTARPW